MSNTELAKLLNQLKNGTVSVEEALLKLKKEPYEDLGFAKLDTHRALRQGVGEVIYGAGKTPEQILKIAARLYEGGQTPVLITKMSEDAAKLCEDTLPLYYDTLSKIGIVGKMPIPDGDGTIVVASGGTSDLPIAEEAAFTALALGNRVERLYD